MTIKSFTLFAGVLCLMASAACAQKGDKRDGDIAMKTKMDSISYVFGASLGANIRMTKIEGVNVDQVDQGLRDGLAGDSAMIISMADGQQMVGKFMQEIRAKEGAESQAKADKYMKDAAAKGDLKSTESGILYEVIKQGDGPIPTATDKVRVHYEGKTTDGKVFDSSYERGEPAEFPVNRVIPGWTEILQQMPVGSIYNVTIPPALAYGERGSQPNIGPNEVLIFKIELLGILPKTETPDKK